MYSLQPTANLSLRSLIVLPYFLTLVGWEDERPRERPTINTIWSKSTIILYVHLFIWVIKKEKIEIVCEPRL